MIRSMLVGFLAFGFASAAPVPKELRTNNSHVGLWREIDVNHTGQFTPGNQYWCIDEKFEVGYAPTAEQAKGKAKTEGYKFDTKTGEIEHYAVGSGVPNMPGRYEVIGDKMTIILNINGKERPKSMSEGGSIWRLERVKEIR